MKKTYFFIFTILLIIFQSNLINAETKNAASNENVAVVNGTAISRADFNRALDFFTQRMGKMGKPSDDTQLGNYKKNILDSLINVQLLYQESVKQGIKIDDKEVEKKFEDATKRVYSKDSDYKDMLKQAGLTEKEFKDHFKKDLFVQEFIAKKIEQNVKVTPEDLKSFYDKNPQKFLRPEMARASHILIKVDKGVDKEKAKKQIEGILEKVKKGEDFANLAKQNSQCPSAAQGGDLNYFDRTRMVKPFSDAAFALKIGEASGIIETEFGYHIIKLTDKKPESTVSFDEAKDKIEQYLKKSKVQKDIEDYITKLRKDAKIETFSL
ncbi:MAG: peptidylprolyl isomerase [Desulfobacterales bacterium]|nr:peptidylprolyl isomerase [Desulfobacterales bacterium]